MAPSRIDGGDGGRHLVRGGLPSSCEPCEAFQRWTGILEELFVLDEDPRCPARFTEGRECVVGPEADGPLHHGKVFIASLAHFGPLLLPCHLGSGDAQWVPHANGENRVIDPHADESFAVDGHEDAGRGLLPSPPGLIGEFLLEQSRNFAHDGGANIATVPTAMKAMPITGTIRTENVPAATTPTP